MSEKTTRRQFHKTVATVGASSYFCCGGDFLSAQVDEQKEDARALQTTAKSLLEIVRARFGRHLNADQLKRVQASIQANLYFASKLDEAKLHNGDEPAFIFPADVPPSS